MFLGNTTASQISGFLSKILILYNHYCVSIFVFTLWPHSEEFFEVFTPHLTHLPYTNKSSCHFSILLFACKLALITRVNLQVNKRILEGQPFWNKGPIATIVTTSIIIISQKQYLITNYTIVHKNILIIVTSS